MPSKTDSDILLICVGLFVIIIVAMMFSTSGLSPYDEHNAKSLTQYPYEGFESAMAYFNDRKPEKDKFAVLSGTPIEGFEGLQSGTYLPEQRIDDIIYSSGSKDCKDYGLTISTGFLCLSDKDVKLLTTRGGNA
jgi:hypothetical protein